MLEKWDDGTLEFKPTCGRAVYNMQMKYMDDYISVLRIRAELEGINLNN